jgi:uncharacterized protein YbgA (DUF1722 family)
MAHSPAHYTEMGRLVAQAGKLDWDELTAAYGGMLMEGLGVMGTRGKHVNVLQHLQSTASFAVMGFLKNHLSSVDQKMMEFFPELANQIQDPRKGEITIRSTIPLGSDA